MPTVNGSIHFSMIDWLALIVYFVLTAAVALWSVRGQKNNKDFFLAGQSLGWLIIGIAVFATLFSSISFVAVPGEAFGHGLLYSLMNLGPALFAPLAIWLFLRFFFLGPTFTAYEYLERRYNLTARLLGATLFCIIRLLYAGIVFYAAAQLMESLMGWPPLFTILIIGIFTVTYTSIGGMKATILTDVLQACVLVIGIGAILFKVLMLSHFDVSAIYQYAAAHDHGFSKVTTAEFYTINLHDRLNFWLILISSIAIPFMSLSADQLVVQRLLSAKGYHGAKWAVLFNYIFSLPVIGMFWLVGIGIFYFYGLHPQLLPNNMPADQVLGYFIGSQLPAPIPGLVIAAMLAALMSTVSSAVNSLATVVYHDGLCRLGLVRHDGPHEMRWCRGLSIAAGMVSVVTALVLVVADEGIKSSVMEISGIWSALWLVLMGAFLLGVLVPRVSGTAVVTGMVLGGAVTLYLPWAWYYQVPADQRISFMWIGYPGMALGIIVPLVVSIFRPNRKDLTNLTHWTMVEGTVAKGYDEEDYGTTRSTEPEMQLTQ